MNLIKLLYVIFCGAINIVVHGMLASVDQNVAWLTQAIRDENFSIVTLTRPFGNNWPLLPWEVLDLFSDINKLFGGSFDTKLHENIASNVMRQIFYRDSTCVDAAKLSGYYKIMQQKMPDSVVNKKSNVNGDVESILLNKKPVILVFQEYFFSKTHALNNEYVNMIIEFCCKLSESVTDSIIIVNFLHEFA